MKILMWFIALAFLLFGARMTYFMGEGAHYLLHHGAFDAFAGFLLLTFAFVPFLVCGLLAFLICWGDAVVVDEDHFKDWS